MPAAAVEGEAAGGVVVAAEESEGEGDVLFDGEGGVLFGELQAAVIKTSNKVNAVRAENLMSFTISPPYNRYLKNIRLIH